MPLTQIGTAVLASCYLSDYNPLITEHQNFFGMDDRLGPVAISFRREEKEASSGSQYNYRIIFRTTEVNRHFAPLKAVFRFSVFMCSESPPSPLR